MPATVLSYGQDPCANWLTDALFYGTDIADRNWPTCKGGARASPYISPPTTTGGAGSAPAPASIPGASTCGSCRKSGAPVSVAAAGGPLPAAPSAAVRRGYPWWVIVLGIMVLAGVVQRERT